MTALHPCEVTTYEAVPYIKGTACTGPARLYRHAGGSERWLCDEHRKEFGGDFADAGWVLAR